MHHSYLGRHSRLFRNLYRSVIGVTTSGGTGQRGVEHAGVFLLLLEFAESLSVFARSLLQIDDQFSIFPMILEVISLFPERKERPGKKTIGYSKPLDLWTVRMRMDSDCDSKRSWYSSLDTPLCSILVLSQTTREDGASGLVEVAW